MKNVYETVAAREFEKLRPTIEGFCECDVCRDDVLVYALNRVKPHYVSHLTGEVLSHLDTQRDQEVARLSVVLLEGFRRVTADPRPDCVRRQVG